MRKTGAAHTDAYRRAQTPHLLFAPAESIGRSQMTDVTNSRRNENIQMQTAPVKAASVKYRQAAARCKAPKVPAAAETAFGRTEL